LAQESYASEDDKSAVFPRSGSGMAQKRGFFLPVFAQTCGFVQVSGFDFMHKLGSMCIPQLQNGPFP
jgi:hypothetical protein